MAALRSRCGHYIFVLFLLLSFFPRLISAVGDWMSTLVRILNAGVKCVRSVPHGWLEMQDSKIAKKIRHLGTIAQLCLAISSLL